MSVRSAQAIIVLFTTRVFSTGAASNADSLPTGTLYVNGVSNAATVTVTNVTTGVYTAAVTLPTLAVGDVVDLRIAATVSTIADNAIIWRDSKDVLLDASGDVTFNNTTLATVTTVTTATNLTNAPTAGDFTTAMKTSIGTAVAASAVASVTAGVTVSTNNDKTGYSLTQSFPGNFAALGISAGGHVSNVDTLTTYTNNTVQTGDVGNLIPTRLVMTSGKVWALDDSGNPLAAAAGVALIDGAITEAKITLPSEPTTLATGFLAKVMQLWNYWFRKRDYDGASGVEKTYAADATTVITTQTLSSTGAVQTQGPAS